MLNAVFYPSVFHPSVFHPSVFHPSVFHQAFSTKRFPPSAFRGRAFHQDQQLPLGHRRRRKTNAAAPGGYWPGAKNAMIITHTKHALCKS